MTRRPPSYPRGDQRGAIGLVLVLLLLGVAGAALFFLKFRSDDGEDRRTWSLTPPLQRQTLTLTLVEKGSLDSINPVEVVNQVEGRTTIISIVPEGHIVTEEEVAAGFILVRLDTSSLEDSVRRQEIEVKSADAALENARSNLEITRRQNESDIRKAELAVTFARIDLERYVGSRLAPTLEGSDIPAGGPDGGEADATPASRVPAPVDYAALLADERLDGEARQQLRQLESDMSLAEEERRRAEEKLKHSTRLEEKGYISREEYDVDRLALQRREIEVERSQTARAQFVTYDFPKEVQRLRSDSLEARDELARVRDKAAAAERRSEAEASATAEQASLQHENLAHLRRQIERCTIRATTPGMVVYASSGNERYWGDQDRIREGVEVRERQVLLRIPSPDRVAATIDIHESVVRRVRRGQAATIVVDAQDGRRLEGRVTEVARMPSAGDRWLNPDRKVYPTTIEIEGSHPELKPGMTASVELTTGVVPDALAIPVQAIVGPLAEPGVWVDDGRGGIVRRRVRLGPSTDLLAVVEDGLQPGDRVVLNPPPDAPSDGGAAEPRNGKAPTAPDGVAPPNGAREGEASAAGTPNGRARGAGGGRPPR